MADTSPPPTASHRPAPFPSNLTPSAAHRQTGQPPALGSLRRRAVPVAPSRRRRYSCRDIMPKRCNRPPAPPPPVQLPLFAETASLVRIRPDEWRFYHMAVWPDLFGRALLVRQWGRIGHRGATPDRGTG